MEDVPRTGRGEPLVLFLPPHALCPVNADGCFLDPFDRAYDDLVPVFGRLVPP
ncbi:MAG: hypothetical protein OXC13_06360 [Caldilineaceae bacterium]|nr:hypothetical protein [Caldilineaceae bacterium]